MLLFTYLFLYYKSYLKKKIIILHFTNINQNTFILPNNINLFISQGPEGEVVITTKAHSLDGSIKINLPSTSSGQYTLSVSYSGRPVVGSPLTFDVVDASRVMAQVPLTGVVGETTAFDGMPSYL